MPLQTRQPVMNSRNMTYGMESPNQNRNVWDHSTHANIHGDRPDDATQVYEPAVRDTVPKNGHSDETEMAKRAVKVGQLRRRGFQNLEDREQTAQTRRDKACVRCRMQKIRVIQPSSPSLLQVAILTTPVCS